MQTKTTSPIGHGRYWFMMKLLWTESFDVISSSSSSSIFIDAANFFSFRAAFNEKCVFKNSISCSWTGTQRTKMWISFYGKKYPIKLQDWKSHMLYRYDEHEILLFFSIEKSMLIFCARWNLSWSIDHWLISMYWNE